MKMSRPIFESTNHPLRRNRQRIRKIPLKSTISEGFWSEWRGSNSRPRGPKPRVLSAELHPDIHFPAMIPRRGVKIKIFLFVVIPVVKAAFMPFSTTGGNPANAGATRLSSVLPCSVSDTATALPKQARYQLRYTPIRYSLCIANPFLTALIVYWILAGKSTARLHIPPE